MTDGVERPVRPNAQTIRTIIAPPEKRVKEFLRAGGRPEEGASSRRPLSHIPNWDPRRKVFDWAIDMYRRLGLEEESIREALPEAFLARGEGMRGKDDANANVPIRRLHGVKR